MAREVKAFPVTVTAGTATDSPSTFSIATDVRILREVTVTFPPGCSGLVGFQLAISGFPVIPLNGTNYIIADNRTATWVTDSYPESGAWQVIAYNTDVFDHTLYVELQLDPPGMTSGAPGINVVPNTSLAPATGGP